MFFFFFSVIYSEWSCFSFLLQSNSPSPVGKSLPIPPHSSTTHILHPVADSSQQILPKTPRLSNPRCGFCLALPPWEPRIVGAEVWDPDASYVTRSRFGPWTMSWRVAHGVEVDLRSNSILFRIFQMIGVWCKLQEGVPHGGFLVQMFEFCTKKICTGSLHEVEATKFF